MAASSAQMQRAQMQVTTSLVLGVQLDEFDFRVFLRDYYRDLRARHPAANFPPYTPSVVLSRLMPSFEPACADRAPGGCRDALHAYARRVHRLDLCITASDYGRLEKRQSPYDFERATYHLGRELASASVRMDAPGYNPYRSTRRINIPFFRDNLEPILEAAPDYLWWELHDQLDALHNVLGPEQLNEVRRRIDRTGLKLDHFGLWLVTLETMHV